MKNAEAEQQRERRMSMSSTMLGEMLRREGSSGSFGEDSRSETEEMTISESESESSSRHIVGT
jgi:hypothetical protein